MTRDEMLKELDALKEITNDTGKRMIDGLKAAVVVLADVKPVVSEKAVEVEKVAIETQLDAGRRHDVRDAGEYEQHKAEKLRFV